MKPTVHIPILLGPIVDALVEAAQASTLEEGWILDCTLGGGGHTGALLSRLKETGSKARVWAIDQDPAAIRRAESTFAAEISEGRLVLSNLRMSQLQVDRPVIGLLADLGFSSDQIEDPARGLSFQVGETLDMRMDPSRPETARDLLKRLPESELADLIYEYGEERFSRRIAKAIVQARHERKLPEDARELAELVRKAVPPPARHGRIHAATRTFQALRIAVNQEIEELDFLLQSVILKLRPRGRAAVLTFHSLEDRRVKDRFRQLARNPAGNEGEWSLLTKKPVSASDEEATANPRARSAHLRIIERMQ